MPTVRPMLAPVPEPDDESPPTIDQQAARRQVANATMLDLLLATADQTGRALAGTLEDNDDLVRDMRVPRTGFLFRIHVVDDAAMSTAREMSRKRSIDPATGRGAIDENAYRNRLLYAATVGAPGSSIWDQAAQKLGVPPPMAHTIVHPMVLLVGERDNAFNHLMMMSGYKDDAILVDEAKS